MSKLDINFWCQTWTSSFAGLKLSKTREKRQYSEKGIHFCTLNQFFVASKLFHIFNDHTPHLLFQYKTIKKLTFELPIIQNLGKKLKTINGKSRNWLLHMPNFKLKLLQLLLKSYADHNLFLSTEWDSC